MNPPVRTVHRPVRVFRIGHTDYYIHLVSGATPNERLEAILLIHEVEVARATFPPHDEVAALDWAQEEAEMRMSR